MSLYSLPELVNVIIDDIGMNDVPIIDRIGTDKIIARVRSSSLKEFSQRCPYIVQWKFDDRYMISAYSDSDIRRGIKYKIPNDIYRGTQVVGVSHVEPIATNGYNDFYYPSWAYYDAGSIVTSIADVQMAAALVSSMTRQMTWEFNPPDIITLYDGAISAYYQAYIKLLHDDSLSTIPPTAFTNFRRLATLDVQWYIYNQYKRLDNLNTGNGEINLKMDEFSGAKDSFYQLLDEWDESASLDLDYLYAF